MAAAPLIRQFPRGARRSLTRSSTSRPGHLVHLACQGSTNSHESSARRTGLTSVGGRLRGADAAVKRESGQRNPPQGGRRTSRTRLVRALLMQFVHSLVLLAQVTTHDSIKIASSFH